VSHSAQARFLHVANGTCTTGLIRASGIPGTLSIWADPLHDGPVPGGLSDDQLIDVRARHLDPTGSCVGTINDLRLSASNVSVQNNELRFDIGYVESTPPRDPRFSRELEAELDRMRAFLGLEAAG
jgi:hypothetical protein